MPRCAASRTVPPGVSYMPRDFMPTKRFSTRSSRPMPCARPSVLRAASRVAGESRLSSSATASPLAISPANDAEAAGKDQRDLTKFCDEKAPGVTDLSRLLLIAERSVEALERRAHGLNGREHDLKP